MTEPSRSRLRETIREILVIVVSILAAFALDAGWDRLQDRSSEREVLLDLIDEFEIARADLESQQDLHLQNVDAADWLLENLGTDLSQPVLVPDTTLSLLMRIATFDRRIGGLESLIQSGRIEIVSDPDLREALSRWPGQVEEMREHQVAAREIYREFLVPRLLISGDLTDQFLLTRAELVHEEGASFENARQRSTAITPSRELRGAISYWATQGARASWEMDGLFITMDEILRRLRAEANVSALPNR